MKFNGQNIIADSDIVMTGLLAGHNLSEVLNKHDEDISNLKSNVKWIYKYGGVGSGSGGSGGGSLSTAPWNFKVELDDVVRENGSKVNLGTLKLYKLFLQLYKVQERTFDIKYTYNSEFGGVKIVEKRITPSQPSSFTDLINLQVNGTLAISINDDEGNYALFTMDYIVTAYNFAINYVYTDDKSLFYPVNNNIFITDVQSHGGLLVRLTLIISVDIKDYYIKYQNWNLEWITMTPNPTDEYIYLDLGKSIDNNNAGNYTFTVEPHLILAGNNEEEKIENLQLSDNLIPDTIYLKVETDGTIYNTNDVVNPYQFYAGEIVFKVTGFLGFKDTTTSYIFSVFLNDNKYTSNTLISELLDLYEETISINIAELGWQKITFKIKRKNAIYEKTYWIYTKSALGSFTWYPSYTIQSEAGASTGTANPIISYLYKYSQQIHLIAEQIPGTPSISSLISQTVGGLPKIYSMSDDINTTYQDKDCLISIGINFSKFNDLSKKIITISGSSTSNSIEIYQNKIKIMSETCNSFYLPMNDKFHLVSIYRRAASKENVSSLFEFIVYIDGIIEATLSGFVSTLENYNTIELNSGLYKVNYLELSYFNHTIIADNKLSLWELYNPNPNKYLLTHLTDTGILYHYYSYKLTFEPESIPDNFQKIYSYVSLFYNNTNTGRVEVTNTGIAAIALDIEIPVLMLKYKEPRNGNNPNYTSDGSAILKWMEESIDIKTNPNALSHFYTVDVAYSKGKEALKNIVVPENVFFQLFLQGTSTLIYKSKNFDLALSTSSPDYTYLYSPNYSSGDPSTFLPEKRFTIKADVVDSSHSNNNAIGKFINTICTKFQDLQSVNENSKYKAYLKNTLEGFPILLFLENAYYQNATTEELTTDYYFLGIYNFNLGRDSEYNLGFKDLRLLPETITDGFAITEIPNDVVINENTTINVNSYLANLGVMEINDNRTYFDFSQDDASILFPVNDDDNDYMFSKFKANSLEILKNSIKNLVTGVSYSGGFIFDQLRKNLQNVKFDTEVFGYGYDLGYKSETPTNSVPNYKVQLKRTFENAQSNLTKIGEKTSGTLDNLSNLILGNEELGTNPLLDYVSLTEYFVICMAFGLLDSVLKNMNFRKWLDKFYLAFYDMDTCLGKDNAGNNSDYLCFSDYWAPASVPGAAYNELRPAVSYKDWYDSRIEGGFDIPSSYLFAVAKYSSKFIEDNTIKDWYPQNVWARFRRKETLLSLWNLPSFVNEEHIGCLSNANSFIDNFFAKHLEKVPDVLFNLNYRIKYLHVNKDDNIFVNEDWKKLSGKRIHYVRDWLNSRFHILDLYFNMASISDSVMTYDITNETWQADPMSTYPLPNPIFIDSTNEDIIVCQDAFVASESGSESTKYSSNIDVIFTSAAHSPIALVGGFLGRYITDSDITQKYRFRIDSNGKSGKLGGSKNWLTLNSINSLIQGNVFYVNSDKLTVLNGDAKSCGRWNIKLPALERITLTSASYTGNLEFMGADNWPNLTDIDIRNSKLGLIINNVGVKNIIATNVGPAETLSLTNCNNLNSVNLSSSIFENIQMTPPLKVVFFGSNTYKQNANGKWEVEASNNPPKCSNLTLTCTSGDGVLFISNQTYTVNGITKGLSTLTVAGYKEIYIDNCPYLQEIVINTPTSLQKLLVKNCAASAPYFKIGAINNAVNLTGCNELVEVSFYSTKKFEKVYLPDNVQIQSSGFAYTNIKTLNGENLKLSTSAFSSSSFTLLKDNGDLCSFDENLVITSLENTFRSCNILLETLNAFNEKYKTLLNQLTNTNYMWWANPAVKYSEKDLLQDYKEGCRFNFSMYINVTTAKGMLGGANVYACHANTLNGFAQNSPEVNLHNLYGWAELSGKVVTIPINWLEHVKTKVTDCNSNVDSVIYKVVEYNEQENTIEQKITFSPKDLFGGNTSNQIKELRCWVFDSNHIIDLKDAFSEFPALQTIYKSFVNCNGKNLEYVQNINGSESTKGFLYSNTTITDILGSFGFNNYESITVDWANFLNWENLPDNYKGFLYIIYWDEKYHTWQFNKTLSTVNLFNIIYNKLLSKYTGDSLFGVFYNCTINEPNSYYEINLTIENNVITAIPYLFSGLKIANNYVNWNWDMINTLPNVVNFMHAFEKIKFANSLPFNLFKRRKENISTVWVKDSDDNFEQAILHKYTYIQDIKNMLYCFLGCEFEIPMYNLETDLVKSHLEIDGEVLETNIYYNNNSALANEYKLENTEFDDVIQVKLVAFLLELSYSNFPLIIAPSENVINKSYYNYIMYNEYKNQSLLPPDIFYGCTNIVDLTGCFKDSNLQGFIPDNLFKNCKSAIIKNFLSKVLVFPKHYGVKYSADQNELLDIYYYIGTNFINSTNLDEAFDFRIHLPGHLELDAASGKNKKLLHVFCFNDSFSVNLNSMKNALPADINSTPEGTIFIILHLPNNIYLNIMYDKSTEEIITDSDGNELEIKRIGTLGFQLNRYNKLMLDKLVNSLFSQFIYGNVFADYTTLASLKRTSGEVITLGDGQFGVSRNAIWPAAPSAVSKLIKHNLLSYTLTLIGDEEYKLTLESNGVKIMQSRVQEFNLYDTSTNYNNSRVNTTNYGINFIKQ